MFQIAGGVCLGLLAAVAILNWWQGRSFREWRRIERHTTRLMERERRIIQLKERTALWEETLLVQARHREEKIQVPSKRPPLKLPPPKLLDSLTTAVVISVLLACAATLTVLIQ